MEKNNGAAFSRWPSQIVGSVFKKGPVFKPCRLQFSPGLPICPLEAARAGPGQVSCGMFVCAHACASVGCRPVCVLEPGWLLWCLRWHPGTLLPENLTLPGLFSCCHEDIFSNLSFRHWKSPLKMLGFFLFWDIFETIFFFSVPAVWSYLKTRRRANLDYRIN